MDINPTLMKKIHHLETLCRRGHIHRYSVLGVCRSKVCSFIKKQTADFVMTMMCCFMKRSPSINIAGVDVCFICK